MPSPRDGQIAQSLRTWQKRVTDVQAFTHMPHTHTCHQQVSPTCMQAGQAYIKSHAVKVVKFSIYEGCKTSDVY